MTLAPMLSQILDGEDFPAPASMLKIGPARASHRPPAAPYDILTNVAHAVYWQDHWLAGLHGLPRKSGVDLWQGDWRQPAPDEFPTLRSQLVHGLKEARTLAAAEPTPGQADLLFRIALHTSYHLGQINLLKRMAAHPHPIPKLAP